MIICMAKVLQVYTVATMDVPTNKVKETMYDKMIEKENYLVENYFLLHNTLC